MDTAIGVLRFSGPLYVLISLTVGLWVHHTARVAAFAAADAAGLALVESLPEDWDCTTSHSGWAAASSAAAAAAVSRTRNLGAVYPVDMAMAADEATCTVTAAVTVSAANAAGGLDAQGVACRPRIRATDPLRLPPDCGLGPDG